MSIWVYAGVRVRVLVVVCVLFPRYILVKEQLLQLPVYIAGRW